MGVDRFCARQVFLFAKKKQTEKIAKALAKSFVEESLRRAKLLEVALDIAH